MTDVRRAAPVVVEERVAPRVVNGVWGALLLLLAGAPLAYGLITQRRYSSAPPPLLGAASYALATPLQTLIALGVTGAATLVIILALPVAEFPRRGGLAVLGALVLGGATVLTALVHGSQLGVGHVALPLTALAMAAFPRPSLAWFERLFTLLLRVFVWGSLAVAAAFPAWAVQRGYDTGIVGLTGRLAGLTPHANALGPIAVVLAVLEWHRRPRPSLFVAAPLAALVWTQSKTSWVSLAVLGAVALARWLRREAPQRTMLPVLVVLLTVGASVWFAVGLAAEGQDTARGEASTENFTGRTAIWEVTLEEWQKQPMLGYGTDLWDDEMDRRYRWRVGFPPGHAHNQVIHTLGESGLIGATGLVLLLISLGMLARKADGPSQGVAGALFLVLVVRAFMEASMQGTPNGSSYFLMFATFGYLMIAANEADDEVADA